MSAREKPTPLVWRHAVRDDGERVQCAIFLGHRAIVSDVGGDLPWCARVVMRDEEVAVLTHHPSANMARDAAEGRIRKAGA